MTIRLYIEKINNWLTKKPLYANMTLAVMGIMALAIVFEVVLWKPNNFLFGFEMDGVRSYYATSYYIKYDEGVHFTGKNYPYGDHLIYTDNQPLITWSLNWVHHNITPILDYTVGIQNGIALLSLLLCMVFLYFICRYYYLPPLYAIFVSILIALLSPQIHRFAGHLSLSHPVLVPATWWLLIKISDSKRSWLFFGLLVTHLTLFGFIHAYNMLIGALFSFVFLGVHAIKNIKSDRKIAISRLIQAILGFGLPLFLFFLFLKTTDFIPDRPGIPYGFFEFRADWRSIFLPVQGPFWQAWQFFYHPPRSPVEGFSYVGGVCTIVLILSFIRFVKYGFSRKSLRRTFKLALPKNMGLALISAVLLLLFSMGYPFAWGLEFLLEWIPAIRQFRSLGRFSWVFFYVFSVYAAFYLYLLFKRIQQKGMTSIAYGILFIAFAAWAWEGGIHVGLHRQLIMKTKGKNIFTDPQPDYIADLAAEGVDINEFQAILPVPFYSVGTDKFVPKWTYAEAALHTYKLSLDSGLPLIAGWLTRTSLTHSAKLIQLLSGPHIEKDIIDDLPSDKPLLIFKINERSLVYPEQLLLRKGELVLNKHGFSLYRLRLDSLKSDRPKVEQRFSQLEAKLFDNHGLKVTKDSAEIYVNTFDQSPITAFGKETAKHKTGRFVLHDGPISHQGRTEFSVWLKIDDAYPGLPILKYEEYRPDGSLVRRYQDGVMFSMITWKGWIRAQSLFQVENPGNKVIIFLDNSELEAESSLIRPENLDIYLPNDKGGLRMFNNYYFEE